MKLSWPADGPADWPADRSNAVRFRRRCRISDEANCARYLDSPYARLFCGGTHFRHAPPLDRSSMTRWRQRIGAERLEPLLAESLAVAQRGCAVEEKHLRRVTIDTTVMPKAVAHPTDSKLLHRGIEILVHLARGHGIRLRQSCVRVAKRAKREAAKLIHPGHPGRPRQAERQVGRLRTWHGRGGTKGPLKPRFAAVRVRVADGPEAARAQHLPGEEAWLVCEERAAGGRKYHLANHPAGARFRALVGTIKARWVSGARQPAPRRGRIRSRR